VCGDDAFATCSRDKTVRVWREAIGGVGFACSTVCAGHQSFVTALAYAPATNSVVSGGRDKKLIAWDPATGDAKATMVGHELDVTAVCILSDGRIASGSMDKAIKIYDPAKSYECVETLTGHESSVLALVALPAAQGGGFLSGSADSTIRAWKNAAGDGVVFGRHADTVRGLAINGPAALVLSASHDTTARAWTAAGAVVADFRGHSALVYAVASSVCGSKVITGSEDDTARVWLVSGVCVQTIPHPGCVWSVAFLPNADAVTCCADGAVRVWSAETARHDPDAAKSLDDLMSQRTAERAQKSLADAQSKLKTEPPSALLTPGDRDGATKVIKEEGGVVAAYAWSAASATWERLGEVTGVSGDGSGKKTYGGKEYDYVFDVDFKDGAPPLKLPFDNGDNPYDAAETFLETSGLPMEYREQVVNFIVQNVGAENVTQVSLFYSRIGN
jgi:phospholipase A-2-activating protein